MNAYGGAMPARRAVIGLGAAAALSAALTPRGAQARAADRPAPQPADDLRAQGRPWIRRGLLNHSTVLQSFSFDERHGRMYALQVMEDGIRLPGEKRAYSHAERAMRGDLCLNQLSMSGVRIGYMYLKGFGHGAAFGVEETARAAGTVWTEWDSHPVSGYGRGIARFRFAPGKVLTRTSRMLSTYRPVPGSTSNTVALDPAHGRLLRYKMQGVPHLALYDTAKFAARDFQPITDFAQPRSSLNLPFQGMTLYGDYAYQLLGTGYGPGNPARPGNTRLYRIDLRTGRVVQQVLERTASSLFPREPEGLAVVRSGGPWLVLGFAHGPSRNRAFSLYYKPID
jgi:hypothetical protein